MAKAADVYFVVDPWKIIEKGFDPAYSRVSESVFSLANETMGVRGCFDEGGSVDSLRGAYVNGVYDLEQLHRSYRGIIDRSHFMIPCAEWLMCRITLDGETLDQGQVQFSDFTRELDMQTGTLRRSFVWTTTTGKSLRLTFLRFVDMLHRERAYQRISFEPVNFSDPVEFATTLSFDVMHEGRQACFWRDARVEADARRMLLQARTSQSGQEVFAGTLVDIPADATACTDAMSATISASIPLAMGQKAQVDKRVVLLFDGTEGEALWQNSLAALAAAERTTLDDALLSQRAYWDAWWRTSDIQIEPANAALAESVAAEQQGIRFCSFQLAQTYNGGSMRHNIGAKGLTGEAYNGHAFWDTEPAACPSTYSLTPQQPETCCNSATTRCPWRLNAPKCWTALAPATLSRPSMAMRPVLCGSMLACSSSPAPPWPTASGTMSTSPRMRISCGSMARRCCCKLPASWPAASNRAARPASTATTA